MLKQNQKKRNKVTHSINADNYTEQRFKNMNLDSKNKLKFTLIIAAIASTTIAGILHIFMVPRSIDRDVYEGIFFLIAGILQVFWILPIIRDWNRIWYHIGIGGTAVLFVLWFAERIPGLESGKGIRLSANTVAIEAFQIAFIGLCIVLLRRKLKKGRISVSK